MTKITFIVRIVRKSDNVSGSGECESHPDPASALNSAFEKFGLQHRIGTIYPKDHHLRFRKDLHPMTTAAWPPTGGGEHEHGTGTGTHA